MADAKSPAGDAPAVLTRSRAMLEERADIAERRMFGGHCFMLSGNMVCGVTGDGSLMVRVGKDAYEEALARPHAREMDFTGRPMRGMVFVAPEGYDTDDELAEWLERGLAFARTLPPK